jgi:morphogenetic protein associated with SpoVID
MLAKAIRALGVTVAISDKRSIRFDLFVHLKTFLTPSASPDTERSISPSSSPSVLQTPQTPQSSPSVPQTPQTPQISQTPQSSPSVPQTPQTPQISQTPQSSPSAPQTPQTPQTPITPSP